MLGQFTPIILHLLDVQSAEGALKGLEMELNDGAFYLLHGTNLLLDCSHDEIAFVVSILILVALIYFH